MITRNEVREAKIAIARAAGRRWQTHAGSAAFASGMLGNSDLTERQERYRERERLRQMAAVRYRAGSLPTAIERIIGPTMDIVAYAPSDAARVAGRPVGRIVVNAGRGMEPEGIATGFLATTRLLVTNWHVLPTQSAAFGLAVNFGYEKTDRGIQRGICFELKPDQFYFSNEALDFALVALDSETMDGTPAGELGFVRLIEATPKILVGQPINIIQHPGGGPKSYAISDNRLLNVSNDGFLQYTTDTLPGSSGSPAFNQAWELVALHHSGVPEMRGDVICTRSGQPWDPEKMNDDDVKWIANEGIRISAIVQALSTQHFSDPSKQALLDELIKSTFDPLQVVAGLEQIDHSEPHHGGKTTTPQPMTQNTFSFTGPVTIHVHTSAEGPMPKNIPDLTSAAALVVPEKAIRFDSDYGNRPGYQEDFLAPGIPSLRVPIPTVTPARLSELFVDHRSPKQPFILKYHHYSLVMNKARRLQMWSAVNVDYSAEHRDGRSRKELGTDKWIPDPRIPIQFQITDPQFYQPAGKIDRGHVVRREDSAWGISPDDIEFSNSDTFHWTNCTPQHEAFNQESPRGYNRKGIWGEFEGYIQKQLLQGEKRCCILAGPVLNTDDPSADFGAGRIQYPTQFWKIVVVADPASERSRNLRAFGFVLSQADVIGEFGIEFVAGRFARYQKSLQAITDLTGVVFDKVLHNADTYSSGNGDEGKRFKTPPAIDSSTLVTAVGSVGSGKKGKAKKIIIGSASSKN